MNTLHNWICDDGLKGLILVVCFLLCVAACAPSGGPVVREVKNSEGAGFGEQDLEQKLEKARAEAQQEVKQLDPEVQKVVQGARRISADEYLRRFPQAKKKSKDYVVGGNDVVTIKVYNEPDLTQEKVRVSSDGMISFPFIGQVAAFGKTTNQIEQEITTRLVQGGYFIDPHISVMVEEYRSKKVLVLGAVNEPGSYPLSESVRVLDILSQAGGIDFEKGGNVVTLVREKRIQGQRQKLAVQIDVRNLLSGENTAANLQLVNEDVIFVPKAAKIYVIGQVQSPGEYTLGNQRLSLVEAIGLAGGFTRIAARSKVRVVRQTQSGEKTLVVNVQEITEKGSQGQDLELQAGDIVVVPESFF
jgi:polysaccharide export outer membrane protein